MKPIVIIGLGGVGLIGLALLARKKPSAQPTILETVPLIKQGLVPANAPEDSPRKLPGKLPTAKRPNADADFGRAVLQLTNTLRSRGGSCGGRAMPAVGTLAWDDRLARSAYEHAKDMALRNYFSHNTPEGVEAAERIQAAGWTVYPVGENIAAGPPTPETVMGGWLDSPGHCRNLLNGAYKHLGVGYYYSASSVYHHYWVQNFGG